MEKYYVYILANQNNSTLYIGVTNDLKRRLYEHKNKLVEGFTEKYNVNKLVYFEETTDIKSILSDALGYYLGKFLGRCHWKIPRRSLPGGCRG